MSAVGAQCTRVYTLSGLKAHLLAPGVAAADISATALCGKQAWPSYWRGVGRHGEREQAADMPLCIHCANKVSQLATQVQGGVIER